MHRQDLLPRQLLLKGQSIEIIKMRQFQDGLSGTPHRHDHYTLMWITDGQGTQVIDSREYEMLTNRVFFMQPGQVHAMKNFERDGWLILFDEVVYNRFLQFHPLEESMGILNIAAAQPYVDLDKATAGLYSAIVPLLVTETLAEMLDGNSIVHLLSVLLLRANAVYEKEFNYGYCENNEAKDVILRLQKLVEENYRTQQGNDFYAAGLHLQARRLNEIVRESLGITVHEIIQSRLLTESKILLSSTPLTVKEICYQLGFSDPAYFNRFFKKYTSLTPANYRKLHIQ